MLKIGHMSFGYIKQPLLLIDTNVSVKNGVLFVFGQEGAGKTTLLELLCGIQSLYVGKISVCGKDPKEATSQITYLPTEVVALKNKTVLENFQFAAEACGKEFSEGIFDEWFKQNKDIKFKKLSPLNKQIFAYERAKIKDANVMLIDISLADFSQSEIENLAEILTNLSRNKNKLLVISINCEDFKKLQFCPKNSEICYIFATKSKQFASFDKFANDAGYMGMAQYLGLKEVPATIENNQNGFFLKVKEQTIKLNSKYLKKIEMYFDEITTKTAVCFFTNLSYESLTSEQFNAAIENNQILLYDSLTTERLK